MLVGIVFLAVMFTGFTAVSNAQETVTIPVSDLKIFQKAAVERDHYKTAYEDEKQRSATWERSAGDWKNLYEAEKRRADDVQGGRIAELLKANQAYKDQAALDKQRLGELEFSVRKLKSQRKWWFGGGLAIGAAGGTLAGYKLGSISF